MTDAPVSSALPSDWTARAADRGISANERGFTVMVRNAMFRRVELLSHRRYSLLGDMHTGTGWNEQRWADAMQGYWGEYDDLGIGPTARAAGLLLISRSAQSWHVRQVFDDPSSDRDWGISADVDLAASDEAGEPVIAIVDVGPITA